MPKNQEIRKVLVIGSGPIVIGQAAEFDYAGTQACRSLKEEGLEVVLINSNPATIMTDGDIADCVYIEPLIAESVKKVIEKEHPDSVLATLGGQTGLNLVMELAEEGYLDRMGVKIIGTQAPAIKKAEDRLAFQETMQSHRRAVHRRSGHRDRGGCLRLCRKDRLPRHRAPRLHSGRYRRRYLQEPRRAGNHLRKRSAPFPRQSGA